MGNTVTRSIKEWSLFEDASNVIDSTISFEQGDLMYLDSGLIRAQKVGDTGANFLGIAGDTVVSGLVKRPYSTDVDGSAAPNVVRGPRIGVYAKVISKTGDAWTPGDLVYPDPATSAALGVSSTAGALVAIGIYTGKVIASAAAGQVIDVLIGQTRTSGALQI